MTAQPLPDRLPRAQAQREGERMGWGCGIIFGFPNLGAWESVLRKDQHGRALLRSPLAALEIDQARLRLGDLPSSLPEGLLPDPFTGQPLHYRPLERGYVVDSVGKNLRDDGGDEK